MEPTITLFALRSVHIAAGTLALIVAPAAMVTAKGGSAHRRWGKAFFLSMAVVAATAAAMACLRPDNIWLAFVAIFSFHQIAAGYRALYLKRMHEGLRPGWVDYLLQGTALIFNSGLLLWGLLLFTRSDDDGRAIIFTVFGLLGTSFSLRGILRFTSPPAERQQWLYDHMSGFLGGYIAAVSAFSAVNMHFIQPVWLQWLWPSMLGGPLIAVWVRYYKGRFAKSHRTRDVVQVRTKGHRSRSH
jgi:uncharacterized membrane protein